MTKTTRRLLITVGYALLLLLSWLLVLPLQAQSPPISHEYDHYFTAWSAHFLKGLLPDDDWRWYKAQCVQESGPNLKRNARSPAGAVGVCQLMPASALDAGLDPEHRVLAKENIMGGAFILRRCTTMFRPRQTRYQRLQLGQACYNAGGGHILKAQVRCGGKLLWSDIAPCLEQITGRHARETLGYVALIPRHYARVTAADPAH